MHQRVRQPDSPDIFALVHLWYAFMLLCVGSLDGLIHTNESSGCFSESRVHTLYVLRMFGARVGRDDDFFARITT